MTNAPKSSATEPNDLHSELCPGPEVIRTRYRQANFGQPVEQLGNAQGFVLGGRFLGLGMDGYVQEMCRVSDSIIRVVIGPSSSPRPGEPEKALRFIDLNAGALLFAVVVDNAATQHVPKLLSPAVANAKKTLASLSPKERAEALAGFEKGAA